MKKEIKENQVRIAYKSEIKIKSEIKEIINTNIFIINQLYNYLIETFKNPETHKELIELNYATYVEFKSNFNSNQENQISKIEQRFVITNKSKIRDYITLKFKKYMMDRKLSIKGLSKPIQLKIEAYLDTFNNINLSTKKEHRYKYSSNDNYGSFETDSAISLIKKKLKKQNGKKITKYFVKIGKLFFPFKNNKLNIKNFIIKKATISRKNNKYFISLSGLIYLNKISYQNYLNLLNDLNFNNDKLFSNSIGIDINFENISLSDENTFLTNNLQNKLNLFSNNLKELQQLKSDRIELNKKVLQTLCKTDKIALYNPNNPKKYSMEAKQLFKTILSQDKVYLQIKLKINKLFLKRTNIQNDFYNKIIKIISTKYNLFFIEKLNVKNMINKDINNQNLYNASLSKFLIKFKNKVNILGKVYLEVDSFNTSKKCHICHNINEISFKDKQWTCTHCSSFHDRDINAAKNILTNGIKTFQSTSFFTK